MQYQKKQKQKKGGRKEGSDNKLTYRVFDEVPPPPPRATHCLFVAVVAVVVLYIYRCVSSLFFRLILIFFETLVDRCDLDD